MTVRKTCQFMHPVVAFFGPNTSLSIRLRVLWHWAVTNGIQQCPARSEARWDRLRIKDTLLDEIVSFTPPLFNDNTMDRKGVSIFYNSYLC